MPDLADAALAEQAVTALFRTSAPPTALFTARAAVTVAALRTLHRLGLQRLVAVIGFGDFVTADLLSPAVTVVAQDVRRIGTTAADLLFARLAGAAGPPATYPVPTVLVPRGSGELPRRLADPQDTAERGMRASSAASPEVGPPRGAVARIRRATSARSAADG